MGELRDQSGAGMMDCKKALAECGGDIEKADEYLRKKGIVSAAKKASRVASEGMVSSYIHAGSRIGGLVEVNSETDFVARGDVFKELVQGLAMQIAASPSVEYVAPEDAAPEFVEAEKKAEMQKEDLASKPEHQGEDCSGKGGQDRQRACSLDPGLDHGQQQDGRGCHHGGHCDCW